VEEGAILCTHRRRDIEKMFVLFGESKRTRAAGYSTCSDMRVVEIREKERQVTQDVRYQFG
jgi:hypothetical protein